MRNQQGLSLVEILISIVILSSIFVVVLSFYGQTLRIDVRNESQIRAKFIAEEEMERLKSLRYDHPDLDAFGSFEGNITFTDLEDYIMKTKIKFLSPKTGREPEPYPVSEEEDPLLKEVIVSVVRKNGQGGQIDLTSFVTP